MYAPVLGAFQSRDPLPTTGEYLLLTTMPYKYADNKPTTHVDPSGLLFGYGYGKYCGYSRKASCPPGSGPRPDDAIDAACERHDCCLKTGWDCWKLTSCDSKLCSESFDAYNFGCAQSYPNDPKKRDACKDAAVTIGGAFCWFVGPGFSYPDGNPIPMY